MKAERVELPPFRLWTYRGGKGTPVLLLHGLSGSARWWDRNVEAIAARHEVVAIDLPGFGRSRHFLGGDLPLGFDEVSQLLARFVTRQFDDRRVHLVGHSMGGQIAIHTAARFPELFKSIVLVSATGIPFAIDPAPHVRALRMPARLLPFAPRLVYDFLRGGPTSVGVATLRLFLDDARDLLQAIPLPALLIWGENDPLVPLRFAEEMKEVLGDAQLAVIPDASHIPMWENAAEFNRRLLRFLADADASPPARREVAPVFSWAIHDVTGGVAWRQSGPSPRVVLVHGLGMSSRYFERLARELFDLGITVAAPDLPGYGFSSGLKTAPDAEAALLAEWASAAGLKVDCWAGHSTACFTVAGIGTDAAKVLISPMWSRYRFPLAHAVVSMPLDALREPWALIVSALAHYWDDGLLRIFRSALRYLRHAREPLPADSAIVAGVKDPLLDMELLRSSGNPLTLCSGAHGVVMADPAGCARVIAGVVRRRPETTQSPGYASGTAGEGESN